VWEKTFGGTDDDWGRSVQVTRDGDYIITGSTGSSGSGRTDVYLLKIGWNHYELDVLSLYGEVTGEGIFSEGSSASFSVSPTTVSESPGIRYVFTGWISGSSSGYTGSNDSATVVMTHDITETAQWKNLYYLTVESDIDVQGEGWYEQGISVELPSPLARESGFGVKKVFREWRGDISAQSNRVEMNGPKTVIAVWENDYSQLLIVGIVGIATVVVLGRAINQNKKKERVNQAKTDTTNKLLKALNDDKAVTLTEFTSEEITIDTIKETIESLINDNGREGWYTEDGSVFLTMSVVKGKLIEITQEKPVLEIQELSDKVGLPTAIVKKALKEAVEENRVKGVFSDDETKFYLLPGIKERIRKDLDI